ncbi:hypothetical protein ACIBO2_34370 [Nonomuraea sp. NPDC050022]|uniref:hypothetical protein n=1 Tax=Nonomuraea sp. NPDC050022 TaxID=3364358 RepID=UPI0037907BB8
MSIASEPRRRIRLDKVGLYGLLGVAALIALFPLLWMLSGSLQSLTELLSNDSFLPADPQWGNYVTAWVQGELGVYLRNSVIYTGSAVLGILLVSSLAGYALARLDFAGKGVFTGLGAWNEYLMALVLFDDNSLMPVQRGLTAFTSAETPQQLILLAARPSRSCRW